MRCTSAVVLSTLAVGQAAAATLHNRHASFHARREASKRGADNNVDWNAVVYDLKDVNWSAVNWKSVFSSTPAAAVQPTPTPQQQKSSTPVAAAPTPEVKKVVPSSAPAPPSSSAAPVQSSQAAAPSVSTSSVNTKSSGNLVSNFLQGVADIAGQLGAKVGTNAVSNNGGIWIGSDGTWGMDVTNSGSQNAVFYCWKSNGFTGMIIKDNTPDISVGLQPGQSVSLSFAANVPAACAPATSSTKLAMFGGISNTWAEVTFGNTGAFDVSKNVNMHGSSISMKGSICTSDMNTCVFQCQDTSLSSCETGYSLINCSAGNGGGGGFDPIMQGVGGGCSMGQNGERLQVSFS